MNRPDSKLSAIVIARNEEARITKCLKSLGWADEILVVDNGSTDATARLAQELGAKVISAPPQTDFARLRNLGKDGASGQWLLYVDADEEMTPDLVKEINEVVSRFIPGQLPVAYFISRQNFYLGHPWPYRDRMERLFWKPALVRWQGRLHELPLVKGKVGQLRSFLRHHTHRTLEEMVKKTNEWSEIEARLRLDSRHPPVVWWRFLRVMLTSFGNSFVAQQGWRAGTVGWIESLFQAFSIFITYAKLWELQQRKDID